MFNNINKYWAEGKYIDLWTIPHFLAGVVLGGLLYWMGVDYWPNFIISMVIIVGWEFFELYFLGVLEHLPNKIMDVVTGYLGFLLMYFFINLYSIGPVLPYLLIITGVYLLLNGWGYYIHLQKKQIS